MAKTINSFLRASHREPVKGLFLTPNNSETDLSDEFIIL